MCRNSPEALHGFQSSLCIGVFWIAEIHAKRREKEEKHYFIGK